MSQPPAPPRRSPFTSEVRMRVPLPIIIPLGALLVIAVITIGMSRILLNVPSEIAVVIAIAVAAGEETTLTFVNDDSSSTQHNISIYANEEAQDNLFEGQVIPGGQEAEYQVPPQKKGEYYFQCDVHPSMNGTVRVTAS